MMVGLIYFFSAYGGKNYFILNDKNEFSKINIVKLGKSDEENGATVSASFGDINHDGQIDVFLGNFATTNYLYRNNKLNFERVPLAVNSHGKTLSTLFSDFNSDGNLDLFVGNDFSVPDLIFLGGEGEGFSNVDKSKNFIPKTAFFTMSIDTADINNDLVPEIFMVDMNFKQEKSFRDYCHYITGIEHKERCRQALKASGIMNSERIKDCHLLGEELKDACIVAIFRRLAIRSKKPSLCDQIPDSFGFEKSYCHLRSKRGQRKAIGNKYGDLPQKRANVLLRSDHQGKYIDVAKELKVLSSEWSWNAKIADLDNDSWQDIYIGNGWLASNEVTSNVFFHNIKGKFFLQEEEKFNLEDFVQTNNYTYVDQVLWTH